MVSFVYQYCKIKIALMALNKLKPNTIMIYQLGILIINKMFGVYLYCWTNKILTWYQCSCMKINGFDNTQQSHEQEQQPQLQKYFE